MSASDIGARGEAAAAAFLARAGMTVVDRNWRCKAGEIDIVALDGDTLVVVEVKTRRTPAKGSPEEAVSPAKQRKLVRLAEAYIAYMGTEPTSTRFDVVAIRPIAVDKALLRHHRAAFDA